LFQDAFGRLQNRSKQDLQSITQCLTPISNATGQYFRSGKVIGDAEQKAITKYYSGLESRISKTTAEIEFNKLLKTIIFSIGEDKAAKELNEVTL
jgi:hypothetical protein